MPPTSSGSISQSRSMNDSMRAMILLTSTPLSTMKRHRLRRASRRLVSSRFGFGSDMIRQTLWILAIGTILLSCLFLYSTTFGRRYKDKTYLRALLDVDERRGADSALGVLNWKQVEQLVDEFTCSQFKPLVTDNKTKLSPAGEMCQAPEEPFDADAFAHRPSGTGLINFSRTLLLVLFNHPHAETIPFVEMLYRPHFPHIVYCLPEEAKNPDKVAKSRQKGNQNNEKFSLPVFDGISFGGLPLFRILNKTFFMDVDIINYPQPFMNRIAGENNYACFVELSRRLLLAPTAPPTNQSKHRQFRAADFDGVLVAADDLLVHLWNLARPGYDPQKPWVMDRPIRVFDIDAQHECAVDEPPQDLINSPVPTAEQTVAKDCQLDVDWQWFRLYSVEMAEFSDQLGRYALESRLFADCHHQLRETLSGTRRFVGNGGAGDFYYVPSSMLLQAHDILSLMAAHNLFVEIAVPTAIRCLVSNSSLDIIHVQGEGMNWAYARSRDRPWSAYSAAASLLLPYYHPLKVAELLMPPPLDQKPTAAARTQDLACFVCQTILPKFRWFRQYVENNNTAPLLPPPWL